jgi:hypothetical protein
MNDDDNDSARHRIGANFQREPIDDDPSPLLNIPRARKRLGDMSKTKMYAEMAKGELEIVKLGGRTFITRPSCDAYIARRITRTIDKAAIKNAKNAAADSVRSRQLRAEAKKLKLTPGKLRGRRERRAAAPARREGEAASRPTNTS